MTDSTETTVTELAEETSEEMADASTTAAQIFVSAAAVVLAAVTARTLYRRFHKTTEEVELEAIESTATEV